MTDTGAEKYRMLLHASAGLEGARSALETASYQVSERIARRTDELILEDRRRAVEELGIPEADPILAYWPDGSKGLVVDEEERGGAVRLAGPRHAVSITVEEHRITWRVT